MQGELNIIEPSPPVYEEFNVRMVAAKNASELSNNQDVEYFLVQLRAPYPDKKTRVALNLCLVIDVSRTMLEVDEHLIIIEVVQKVIIAVIETMTEHDQLSIVTFGYVAIVLLPMTVMNDYGKNIAKNIVKNIEVDYRTNLYEGLSVALEQFKALQWNKTNLGAVLVFTDGEPNTFPDSINDEGNAIQNLLKQQKGETGANFPIINIIGCGPRVDSELMCELAEIGGGQFMFALDATYIGSTFFYAIASLYTTFARNVHVAISFRDRTLLGAPESEVFQCLNFEINENGDFLDIDLHTVRYGQILQFLVPLNCEAISLNDIVDLTVTVTYRVSCGSLFQEVKVVGARRCTEYQLDISSQLLRSEAAVCLRRLGMLAKNNRLLTALDSSGINFLIHRLKEANVEEIQQYRRVQFNRNHPKTHIKYLRDGLISVVEILKREKYLNRWNHYALSLSQAYIRQNSINSIEYGTKVFESSLINYLRSKYYENFKITAYNRKDMCFSGSSEVLMADGSFKPVHTVSKGDLVLVDPEKQSVAKVVCVVKSVTKEKSLFVTINPRLILTPYHPIFVNGKWMYPLDHENAVLKFEPCQPVYSFVLDSVFQQNQLEHLHTVHIGGIPCATLGHGLKGEIIRHKYFGTDKVLEDLQGMPGWKEGLVKVSETKLGDDGKVCGLIADCDITMKKFLQTLTISFIESDLNFFFDGVRITLTVVIILFVGIILLFSTALYFGTSS